jgi:hypothetical protein
MSFSTETRCVITSYQSANDWAVLVCAARSGEDRYITPFIFAGQHAPLFAECGRLRFWIREGLVHELRTRELSASQQKNIIADAVDYTVEGIQSQARVLEYIKNPGATEAMFRRLASADKLENFRLGEEPAYRWLIEKADAAWRVHATIRHLVRKHELDKLSQDESENLATRQILTRSGARQITRWR